MMVEVKEQVVSEEKYTITFTIKKVITDERKNEYYYKTEMRLTGSKDQDHLEYILYNELNFNQLLKDLKRLHDLKNKDDLLDETREQLRKEMLIIIMKLLYMLT